MPFFGIVLLAWIPICTGLFAVYSPVRACTAAYLIGWLLMPVGSIQVRGFWDLDKVLATNVGVVAGVMLFASGKLLRYRPQLADVFLLCFLGSAFAAYQSNGLGMKGSVSAFGHVGMYFGVPFVMGRVFCDSAEKLNQVARIIVLSAAAYTVLAVFEWRMSPEIHQNLYGFFQHSWGQHYRWGSYRPVVCFPHALGLGIFLAWTGTLALDLWQRTKAGRDLTAGPWMVVTIGVGVLVSMSFAPWLLFVAGCLFLIGWKARARRWLVVLPILFCVYWVGGRYTGVVDGGWMIDVATSASAERAGSLQFRIEAEDILLRRAKERPLFGWGGWGRSRVDEYGNPLPTAADGLWIIMLGLYGGIGLGAFLFWWWTPIVMAWNARGVIEYIPGLRGTIVALGMQSVNLMFNGFVSPVLTFLAGGVCTVICAEARRSAASARR